MSSEHVPSPGGGARGENSISPLGPPEGTQSPAADRLPEAVSAEPVPDRADRLTLRRVVRDAMNRFFNIERGWLRTARELFTQPGAMLRRYMEGDRASYANPFTYLVVCTAINVVMQTVTSFQTRMLEGAKVSQDMSPGQAELTTQLTQLVSENTLYLSAAILIPFAFLLRLFFRRSGYNLAEVLVFALYGGGQLSLLSVVTVFLYLVFPLSPLLFSVLAMMVPFAYFSYAAVGFFGKGLGTIVKTILAYTVSYATFMGVLLIATLIYISAFRPSFIRGEDWNLVTAAEQNLIDRSRELLVEGADVNLTLRRTPLHIAAEEGHAEMVDLLVAHGANLNARTHLGHVPMALALIGGHQEIAWRLAEAGTDSTACAEDDATLLILALRLEDERLARWSLKGGADVNAVRQDARQATALIVAAADDDLAMVDLLLSHGADPSLTNKDGKTAFDFAKSEEVKARLR